jgi:hypothetical protein
MQAAQQTQATFYPGESGRGLPGKIPMQDMPMKGMDGRDSQSGGGDAAQGATFGCVGMHDIWSQAIQSGNQGRQGLKVIGGANVSAKSGNLNDLKTCGPHECTKIILACIAGSCQDGHFKALGPQHGTNRGQHSGRTTIIQACNDMDHSHGGILIGRSTSESPKNPP